MYVALCRRVLYPVVERATLSQALPLVAKKEPLDAPGNLPRFLTLSLGVTTEGGERPYAGPDSEGTAQHPSKEREHDSTLHISP